MPDTREKNKEPAKEMVRPQTMYSAIQQPAPLCEAGNLALNWREWKSAFDYFLIASGRDSSNSKEKVALFLHVIGRYGREIYEELEVTDANYDQLVKKFSEHCDPTRNVNFERHIFFEMQQGEDNFEKFMSTLKRQSRSCEFGELRSSLILTQVIRGVRDPGIRERMLAKQNLQLEEAVQWCRAAETAGQQAELCARGAAARDVATAASTATMEPAIDELRGARGRRPVPSRRARMYQQRSTYSSVCDKCGRGHRSQEECSARSMKCYRCDRVGHVAKMCKTKFVREVVHSGNESENEFLLSSLSIDTVNGECSSWYETVSVNNVNVNFKLDSGADVSVLSLETYKEAGFQEGDLKKDTVVLREISRSQLPVVGYFEPILSYKGINSKQKVYVLDVTCNNLLGLNACESLKLIARINELSQYNFDDTIFNGIGRLPNVCKIQIDESVQPVVNASRKIPIKMRPLLENELKNMEKMNIIVKEEGPTDWVSNIVIVERPDKKIRLCLDPCHLNKAVRRCHFQLPTLDEISSNLTGAKYFTKLDANRGFWMLCLDEASSKLCTFATPFGRYRFLRMPFGISSAPEIFHNEMYKIFSMPGVEVFCDDILVWGESKLEHDNRLKIVMERAKINGVKFNKSKCSFGKNEVKFLGHTFSKNGMSLDDSRIQAVVAIPKPSDKKALARFMGITNYLSRFIPKYSEVSAPLRELLKQDTEFEWCHTHDRAFLKLKELITTAPVLQFYSPREPVTVSVDASSHGLGACLLQAGQPVAYAARTLAPTETRWAQIEKELLAIVFGCERFHQYIYGHSEVIVESDHKPLETIFKKALNETPARLQRLMLRLQGYSLKIVYKPGKEMFISDALSRAATRKGTDAEVSDDITVHVNAMFDSVNASPEKLDTIRVETSRDNDLLSVINYYFEGWPDNKTKVKVEAKSYWSIKDELHVVNGILFRRDKIVIPKLLRKEMLSRIHEGHLGIEKSKRRAREVMWWPGMSAEIEAVVKRCDPCQRHRAANRREPLAPHPTPNLPWQILAADVFEYKNKYYLLIVDYYSKFIEVITLPNLLSGTVILKMKSIFARFGIPSRLVTDNATQFSSAEFKRFADTWEIQHVTSSPMYPRSNGLAERNVQSVKRLFKKASEDGTEWQLALLNFRNTPITGESYSPAQLLMGRTLRTRLPAAEQTLRPRTIEPPSVDKDRKRRVDLMKTYYDRGTREQRSLSVGEDVRVRNGRVWEKARVVEKADGDRSYWLKMDNGGVYRRNRHHIMANRSGPLNYPQGSVSVVPDTSDSQSQVPSASSPEQVQPPPAASGIRTSKSGRIIRPPNRY